MKKITKRFFPEKTKNTNRTKLLLKTIILVLVGFSSIQGAIGQTTIFSYANTTASIPSGWTLTNNVTTNVVDRSTFLLVDAGSPSDLITTENMDLSSYSYVVLNVQVATFGSGVSRPLRIDVSSATGATFTSVANYTTATPSDSNYIAGGPIVIPAPSGGFTSTTKLRFSNNGISGRGVRIQSLNLVAPTQASNVTFSSVGAGSFTTNWTDGSNGSTGRRLVFVAATSSGTAAPANGATYTANTTFGSGTQIATNTGWFCVYNGTGAHASGVTVTGLNGGTTYRVMVCENEGTGATSVYNTITSTNNPNNQATTVASNPSLAVTGTIAHGTTCPTVAATVRTYTITNSGTAASDVVVSSNDPQFVVSNLSSISIAGTNGTATYDVTFTPSSSGAKTATISVFFNTSTLATTSSLTGTGSTPVTAAVTSSAASSVAATTATLNGNVTALGVCPATTEKGFVYSLTSANSDPLVLGTGVTKTSVSGLTTGAFILALTGLTSGTGYSFKSYVYDGATYTYGAVTTFTTTTPPANDLCGAPAALEINGIASNGTTVAASYTSLTNEPFTAHSDVWYTFTPVASGNITISTSTTGTDYDLYAFAACPTSAISYVTGGNAANSGNTSESMTFAATTGIPYFVRVVNTTSTAGSAFTISATQIVAPPTLTAAVNPTVDASFNVTFTDNSAWRSAISSITVGGTTLAPAAYSISDGQITFTPSASDLLQSSGAKTIVVLATGYSNATVSQTILAGIPANLGITTQPTAPSANGGMLAAQPVIRIRDQYNNTTTSTASVTATAVQGTWTLGGTTAVSGLAGTSTFSGLTAASVGLVTGATIQFTSPGLTSVTSNSFNIPAPVVDFVSIAALGTVVTENFDGMAASIGAVIPVGFGIQNADTASVSLSVGLASSTGSPTSGDSYNWGQSASERALGLMFSGSYSNRSVIVKLRNNTGTAVSSFTIGFDYEQYRRNNGVTQTFKLQYSTSLTSGWVDVTGGAFTNIVSGTSSYGYSSLIASQNISNLIYTPAALINAGSDVYFRWILDGGSSSRGVGIDNFSITAKATPTITTPPTATAIALGQTLANSTLSGGATSGDIAGTFTFTTPSTAPLAGTASQGVSFTPSNTTSYNTATTTASVTVSDVTTYTNTGTPSWSFGVPTSTNMNAVIAADYGTNNGAITAKNLTVNSGVRFTVNAGANGATISENITNNGFIVVENNANLIQTATGADANTSASDATVLVHRNSNSLFRLDYTMWSSPVSGDKKLFDFSPLTTPLRNYEYLPGSDKYSSVGNQVTFITGKGYLIRMPDALSSGVGANLTDYYKGLAPLTYEGAFWGKTLNNGTVTISTTTNTFNAVGNPYPSTISADAFLAANSTDGTLYFWRKTNGGAAGTAYAQYTRFGGVGTISTVARGGITPDGTIQVGQGFIVKATGNSLVFNNTMRATPSSSQQFFKTKAQAEKSRIWFNLNNAEGMVNQTLVGYVDGATNGVDNGIDGKSFGDGTIELASSIDGESYTIQGRPAFDATDVVALNFKTSAAGTYSIAIDHVDGLFSNGQAIYLVDKTTGTTTNLNEGAYTFTAEAGVDNTRFTLTYQKTLKIDAPLFNENSVLVSRINGTLNVKSTAVAINNVKVFDVQGRLVAERKNVKSNTASFSNLKANQVLIVKVTSENNVVVTKKVLN